MLWRSLARDRSGAAAAEMALVSPMLIILMFGSFELGNYFLDEHVVLKAVRDGARYAARQNFTTMPCSGTPTADAAIKNLVRYGNIAGSGDPRLRYWTSNNTRSEEHTSELQSLMRISYAVFTFKKITRHM